MDDTRGQNVTKLNSSLHEILRLRYTPVPPQVRLR